MGRDLRMHVGELLCQIAEHGVSLRCSPTEDRLHYAPAGGLPPELVADLREHKQEVIQVLREDEELRRTGTIQSERQVFELAREHLGLDEKGTLRET
jgi:TubC N-terminal docking domain